MAEVPADRLDTAIRCLRAVHGLLCDAGGRLDHVDREDLWYLLSIILDQFEAAAALLGAQRGAAR